MVGIIINWSAIFPKLLKHLLTFRCFDFQVTKFLFGYKQYNLPADVFVYKHLYLYTKIAFWFIRAKAIFK